MGPQRAGNCSQFRNISPMGGPGPRPRAGDGRGGGSAGMGRKGVKRRQNSGEGGENETKKCTQ